MNRIVQQPETARTLLLPERDLPYILKNVYEKIVHGCRDEIVLDLETCFLLFRVNIDSDELSASYQAKSFHASRSHRSIRTTKLWSKYIGKSYGWNWLAVNQQGYLDTVLISFMGIEPNVMLQAVASSIEVFAIVPAKSDSASAMDRNGKRKTKAKTVTRN